MALPFARSERSLQTDDYRTAWLCTLLALPLFVAWLVWFFTSDLPVPVVSQKLSPSGYDTVIANFALEQPPDLHAGDAAWLRLQLPGNEGLTSIPALVSEIQPRDDGSYDVYLYPVTDVGAISALDTLNGHAEVDVDDRSPFTYLLQLGNQ